jgi:hypothetical protein
LKVHEPPYPVNWSPTAIPTDPPDALTPAFAEDPLKQRQWVAFATDLDGAPEQLRTVIGDIANVLMSATIAVRE